MGCIWSLEIFQAVHDLLYTPSKTKYATVHELNVCIFRELSGDTMLDLSVPFFDMPPSPSRSTLSLTARRGWATTNNNARGRSMANPLAAVEGASGTSDGWSHEQRPLKKTIGTLIRQRPGMLRAMWC